MSFSYLYSSFCVSMFKNTYPLNVASCSDCNSVRTTTICVNGCPPSDDFCLTPWVSLLTCIQFHLLFHETILIHIVKKGHMYASNEFLYYVLNVDDIKHGVQLWQSVSLSKDCIIMYIVLVPMNNVTFNAFGYKSMLHIRNTYTYSL